MIWWCFENVLSLNDLLKYYQYDRIIEDKKLPGMYSILLIIMLWWNSINGWEPKVHWTEGLERTKEWLIQSL